MANERIICCCGASKWTKVIAWFEIVLFPMLLVFWGAIIYFKNEAEVKTEAARWNAKTEIKWETAICIFVVLSILGLIMAIILRIGTNQKRVSCIEARLVYEVAMIVVLNLCLLDFYDIVIVISVIMVIALKVFLFGVFYIHMKEIQKGVFDLHSNLPVTV